MALGLSWESQWSKGMECFGQGSCFGSLIDFQTDHISTDSHPLYRQKCFSQQNHWMNNDSFIENYETDSQFYLTRRPVSKNYFSTTSPIVRAQSATSYWRPVSDYNSSAEAAANAPILVAQETSGSLAAANAPILPETNVSPAASNFSGTPVGTAPILGNETISLSPSNNGTQTGFSGSVDKVMRFLNKLSLNYTFIPKSGSEGLGINNFNFHSRFAVPCDFLSSVAYQSESNYFYITPGFALDLWSGMKDSKVPYEMPSSTFDASLAFGVMPQLTQDFGIEAWISVGLASSFEKVKTKSIYVRGRAMGNLVITDNLTATGGVIYYCRNRYKILPSGGVVWKPNRNNEWRLVFPDPRLAHYLKKINETDWWVYLQGNIGGGRWLISDKGQTFNTDYNDYRLGIGMMFDSPNCLSGSVEIGGAFGRELYAFGNAWYKPKTALYIKGGIAY